MKRRTESPLTPTILSLENNAALDSVVSAAAPLMDAVTRSERVSDLLQGKALGHAIHPILVQVPLGTWMSAALLDSVGDKGAKSSAQLLTAAGLVGALPAAITGWAELAQAGQRERRVGVVHAAANAVGAALQIMAMRERGRGRRGAALALSGTAMGVLGAAGYLGGHLAVARKVGSRDAVFAGAS